MLDQRKGILHPYILSVPFQEPVLNFPMIFAAYKICIQLPADAFQIVRMYARQGVLLIQFPGIFERHPGGYRQTFRYIFRDNASILFVTYHHHAARKILKRILEILLHPPLLRYIAVDSIQKFSSIVVDPPGTFDANPPVFPQFVVEKPAGMPQRFSASQQTCQI